MALVDSKMNKTIRFVCQGFLLFSVACSNGKQEFGATAMAVKTAKPATAPTDANVTNGGSSVDQKGIIDVIKETLARQAEAAKNLVVAKIFEASKIVSGESTFTMGSSTASTNVTLQRAESNQIRLFNQITRSAVTDSFTQGVTQTETFSPSQLGLLDVLVVLDDSDSMREQRESLGNNLPALLQSVQGTNWRVGVITMSASAEDIASTTLRGNTTDTAKNGDFSRGTGSGNLRVFLSAQDGQTEAQRVDAFKNAVVSSTGNSVERGILQAVVGLSANTSATSNEKFLRPDSNVAVLFVSDDDNCGQNPGCNNELSDDPLYLKGFLTSSTRANRAWGSSARIYGLLWTNECSPSSGRVGSEYLSLINGAIDGSGGIMSSLCSDFEATLKSISDNVKTTLKRKWELKNLPKTNSVKVSVDGVVVGTDKYSVSGKILTLSDALQLQENSVIEVKYTPEGSSEPSSAFRLSKKALSESVAVKVNGVDVNSNEYTVSTASPSVLTFTSQPPNSASISVSYKEDTPLTTSFSFTSGEVKAGSLKVSVNGTLASSPAEYSFDATSTPKKITFVNAPPESASVEATFVELGDKILTYPVDLGNVSGVTASRAENPNVSIKVTYNATARTVTFQENQFVDGLDVKVSYPIAMVDGAYPLPVVPLEGSVSVTPASGTCSEFTVNENLLTLGSSCALAPGTSFIVDYHTLTEVQTSFDMGPLEATYCDAAKWELWVNGEVSTSFSREGCVFSSTAALANGAVVKIVGTGR